MSADREQLIGALMGRDAQGWPGLSTRLQRAEDLADAILALPDPELEALREVAEAAGALLDELDRVERPAPSLRRFLVLRVALAALNPRQAA